MAIFVVHSSHQFPSGHERREVIFSMVKVNHQTPTGKHILKDIYLSFFYGAKIGILGLNG